MPLVILNGILWMSVSYFYGEVDFGGNLRSLPSMHFRKTPRKDVPAPSFPIHWSYQHLCGTQQHQEVKDMLVASLTPGLVRAPDFCSTSTLFTTHTWLGGSRLDAQVGDSQKASGTCRRALVHLAVSPPLTIQPSPGSQGPEAGRL